VPGRALLTPTVQALADPGMGLSMVPARSKKKYPDGNHQALRLPLYVGKYL
jgi:hypothetical protein